LGAHPLARHRPHPGGIHAVLSHAVRLG
jgi:hypothetical protein